MLINGVLRNKGNLFGNKEKPFELAPTKPTHHQKVAVGREKGEIGKPKGSSKSVYPQGRLLRECAQSSKTYLVHSQNRSN